MNPRVYALDGIVPVIHPTAFVHPTAVLIGDVIVGPRCYIGPLASLRGDFGRIRIGAGANVQDSCVMHTFPDETALIEEDGHIGHATILHGCRIGRNALVGMNSAAWTAPMSARFDSRSPVPCECGDCHTGPVAVRRGARAAYP